MRIDELIDDFVETDLNYGKASEGRLRIEGDTLFSFSTPIGYRQDGLIYINCENDYQTTTNHRDRLENRVPSGRQRSVTEAELWRLIDSRDGCYRQRRPTRLFSTVIGSSQKIICSS